MNNARLRRQKLVSEINITPFTDVILVLLVIFMVATPLLVQSNLKVNLPQAKSGAKGNESRQARITITNENTLYLDDDLVTYHELRERIKKSVKDNPEIEVILFSDKLVTFKSVVAVLDILNEVGIKNLNVATKVEQQ